MKKQTWMFIVFILSAFLLGACSERDPLIGKWQEPVSGITMEFNDDATLVIGRGGASFTVDYEKQEPNIIAVTAADTEAIPIQSMTYRLIEEQLILTIDKVDTVFIRVK